MIDSYFRMRTSTPTWCTTWSWAGIKINKIQLGLCPHDACTIFFRTKRLEANRSLLKYMDFHLFPFAPWCKWKWTSVRSVQLSRDGNWGTPYRECFPTKVYISLLSITLEYDAQDRTVCSKWQVAINFYSSTAALQFFHRCQFTHWYNK